MSAVTPLDAAKLIDGIADELDHLTQAELLEVGHFATQMIVLRTKKGVDADRMPFAAYSPAYAEQRLRRGLSSHPDLVVTGHMLGALQPRITGVDEVTLRFVARREAQKAEWQNYGTRRGIKPRQFAAVKDPKELAALEAVVSDLVSKRIAKPR